MGGLVLRHGSLFSGIGGFDLAAEWCGWKNIFHCEINDFCNRVLGYYWPKAASIKNIVGYEWEKWKGKIDVLTGGFPCQPYSIAGKRLGDMDTRHLWPEMLRAIKAIRPGWVVGENVRGLLSWNEGMVFNKVQSDLEDAGYEVLPVLLPAAGVNAPHRRERIWIIAHRNGIRRNENRGNDHGETKRETVGKELFDQFKRPGEVRIATNPGSIGCNNRSDNRQERQVQDDQMPSEKNQSEWKGWQRGFGQADSFSTYPGGKGLEGKTRQRVPKGARGNSKVWNDQFTGNDGIPGWDNFPQTQPTVRIGDDGFPDPLDFDTVFESIPFPVKPISFAKWRTESIKAYGNAIVPQVAFQIFQAIQQSII